MKATDYIVNYISNKGVHHIFGYQGGNIAYMIDSIWQHPDLEFVSTYNEQGASFSACGYALENQTIGVALASSGPGAVNLISGIANAYYDSIPTLFITGNVSTLSMKYSDKIRQNAFQENDIVSMVSKITKYAVTVMNPHDLKYHLKKAIYLAQSGRPGPVLLDLPHNIQKTELDYEKERDFTISDDRWKVDCHVYRNIIDIFRVSHRPIIVVGGGANNDTTRELINMLLRKWNVPVIVTLRGLSAISHKSKNYVGFGGAYGNRAANYAIKFSDTILVLGSRLDERFIYTRDKDFFNHKKIVHVDIDSIELNRIIPSEYGIECDVSKFLSDLLAYEIPTLNFERWIQTVQLWNNRYSSVNDTWTINKAVSILSANALDDAIVSLDIGTNQMCAAQSLILNEGQHCYTSAGHGAMGCSIPTAIGAVFANKNKVADCYIGDGALHMNIQELLMLRRNELPVHIILNNNMCLGMIRDFQTKAFSSRFVGTIDILQKINYEDIARTYKLKYCKVEDVKALENAVEMIRDHEPCFIELIFPEESDTNPQLGSDMFSQLPMLSEEERVLMEQEAMLCGNTISW